MDRDTMEWLKSLILNKHVDGLQTVLSDKERMSELISDPLDSVDILCSSLEPNTDNSDMEKLLHAFLTQIAESGNHKEVLCALNSHVDRVNSDHQFMSLLAPLGIALKRLEPVSNASTVILQDCIRCALRHFRALPQAHYSGLEAEELDVYIQSSETQRFLLLSSVYLEFLESLSHFYNNTYHDDGNSKLRVVLAKHVLQLYKESLIKLAFFSDRIVAEESRKCCLRAFKLLCYNVGCIHNFIRAELRPLQPQQSAGDAELVPYEGICCLVYHVFVDGQLQQYPRIYSVEYNLNFVIEPLTNCLQNSQDSNVLQVCLKLLQWFCVAQIQQDSIKYEPNLHLPFFRSLKVAMTSNFNRELRGFAYKIFVDLFHCTAIEGRYGLLRQLLREVDHSGLKGQMIVLLKEEILTALTASPQESEEESPRKRIFTGSSLYAILGYLYTLPDGQETDVVAEWEWIVAALNLLFVVCRRDSKHLVGLDVLIDDFEREFVVPLRAAVTQSSGQYEAERQLIAGGTEDGIVAGLMSGPEAALMDREQQLGLVDKALLTLDLVRCNLARIAALH